MKKEHFIILGNLYDAEMRYIYACKTCPVSAVVDGCKDILNKIKKKASGMGINEEDVEKYAEIFWITATSSDLISYYMNNCIVYMNYVREQVKNGKEFIESSKETCPHYSSSNTCSPLCNHFKQATEEQASLFEYGIVPDE